jgi:hypothetical protein
VVPAGPEEKRSDGAISRHRFVRIPRAEFLQGGGKLLQIILRLRFPLCEGSTRFPVGERRRLGKKILNLALHRVRDLPETGLGRAESGHPCSCIHDWCRGRRFILIIGAGTRGVTARAQQRFTQGYSLITCIRNKGVELVARIAESGCKLVEPFK